MLVRDRDSDSDGQISHDDYASNSGRVRLGRPGRSVRVRHSACAWSGPPDPAGRVRSAVSAARDSCPVPVTVYLSLRADCDPDYQT